jgi:hypothetical protein
MRHRQLIFLCGLLATTFAPFAPDLLAQTPLVNEFMASNATTIVDDDGDYSDWIELYNPGQTAYDLTGYFLSDDADNPLRWQFPSGTVPAQGYLLVWASGKDRQSPGGDLHANFAISASGEPLLLTAPDGVTRLDEIGPIALATDISYGRLPDGADHWVEFTVSTPGQPNDEGLQSIEAPIFSLSPGQYPAAITLALTTSDPQAVITYTLDGSEPTLASPAYTGPLVLDSRVGDPNTISLIPTNFRPPAEHFGWRPPRGEVFKINLVRARAFLPGQARSRITTGSFIVGADLDTMLPLPVVSLATAAENLFDDATGIYVPGNTYVPGDHWTGNYYQSGDEWERPVHLELFDRAGQLLLAQDAGVRIHGTFSRQLPQKSFRLYARAHYGASRFNTQLFPDLPYDSYNRFLIRNGGGDWGRRGFRDLLVQVMVGHMGFDTQAGRAVIHFLNGEYWGLANLRERFDRHYLDRVYGVPEDEVALLYNDAIVVEGSESDAADYRALRSFVTNSDMTQPTNLAQVAGQMDLENFVAYNVAEIYTANRDWPGNNIRFWRRTLPTNDPDAPYGHDGRWRWMMFDMDDAFWDYSHDTLATATADDGPGWPNPPWSTALLRGLLENEWFRHSFINAFADHMNSTFKPAQAIGLINEFADRYEPAIAAWQDRWDINYNWAGAVQTLRTFANQRPAHQRQHIIDHFSLAGTTTVTLDVNDPALGKLQLNQLVIDADLPGLANPAQPYPWGGTYFQGVPITVTALPQPGYRLAGWIGHDGDQPVLTIVPGTAPVNLTAVFALDPYLFIPVHAWHFNDLPDGTLTAVAADLSLVGTAVITYPGTGGGYMDRVNDGTLLGALPDTPAGYALRARNPSDTRHLHLHLPTGGYVEPQLSVAAWRTVNGAQEVTLEYSLTGDAGSWQQLGETVTLTEVPAHRVWDFGAIEAASDNPNFQVRLRFGGSNAAGASGNTRHDNITLFAKPLVTDPTSAPTAPQLATPQLRIYPNPFNPACTIRYTIPREGPATLEIFDLGGRRVRTLLSVSHAPAGPGTAIWAGVDDHGRNLASGSYLCRLVTTDGAVTRKIQLLK